MKYDLREILHDILSYYFVIGKAKLEDNFRNMQLTNND